MRTDTPIDLGLLLAASRRAWSALTADEMRMAYLVPTPDGAWWHVAVVEVDAGVVDGSKRPVSPVGVAALLRFLGVEPDGLDFRPDPDHRPSDLNPFFA